jgi:hypothetical protein
MTLYETLILSPLAYPDKSTADGGDAKDKSDVGYPFMRAGILVAESIINLNWSGEHQAVLVI